MKTECEVCGREKMPPCRHQSLEAGSMRCLDCGKCLANPYAPMPEYVPAPANPCKRDYYADRADLDAECYRIGLTRLRSALADAEKARDEARAEVARLREGREELLAKVVEIARERDALASEEDPLLKEFAFEMTRGAPWSAQMIESHPRFFLFVHAICGVFASNEAAVNYLEMPIDGPSQLVLIIQRVAGKTPHDFRLEAESALAVERTRRESLEGALRRDLDLVRHGLREAHYFIHREDVQALAPDPIYSAHVSNAIFAVNRLAALSPAEGQPPEGA